MASILEPLSLALRDVALQRHPVVETISGDGVSTYPPFPLGGPLPQESFGPLNGLHHHLVAPPNATRQPSMPK
jgi:hypothetical protein